MANEYARALHQAKLELAGLEARRTQLKKQIDELDRRIENQKDGIRGLAKLQDESNARELDIDAARPLAGMDSFRDGVIFVLKTSRETLTPVQVKEFMETWGYDLTKYKSDFLASLHTVLKRLVGDGLVDRVELAHGKKGYRWITETEKIADAIG